MVKKCFKLLSFTLLLASAAAHAQQAQAPLYGELAFAPLRIKSDGDSIHVNTLRGIVGYELHPNVAVEGHLGLGVGSDSGTLQGDPYKARIRHALGLYVKPKAVLSPDVEVFARLGYARIKTKLTIAGDTESITDSGASYGLGLAYRITPKLAAVVDYTHYHGEEGTKIHGYAIGLRMQF